MIGIFDIGIIITAILSIVFLFKGEERRAIVSFVILLAIMLLQYILK